MTQLTQLKLFDYMREHLKINYSRSHQGYYVSIDTTTCFDNAIAGMYYLHRDGVIRPEVGYYGDNLGIFESRESAESCWNKSNFKIKGVHMSEFDDILVSYRTGTTVSDCVVFANKFHDLGNGEKVKFLTYICSIGLSDQIPTMMNFYFSSLAIAELTELLDSKSGKVPESG